MKKALTIVFIFIVAASYGQTKKETQDWIINKIDEYAIYSAEPVVIFKVDFDENHLIVRNIYYERSSRLVFIYKVPLDEIGTISFLVDEEYNWVDLILRTNKNRKSIFLRIEGEKEGEFISSVKIPLKMNIEKNDMKNRLEKALTHLVELHGGKIDKEPF